MAPYRNIFPPYDTWYSTDDMPRVCQKCNANIPVDTDNIYINALELVFSGGYGWFTDTMGYQEAMLLCHDCAHKLCVFLDLKELPFNHTHSDNSSHTLLPSSTDTATLTTRAKKSFGNALKQSVRVVQRTTGRAEE